MVVPILILDNTDNERLFILIAERRALASEARPMIVVYSRFCNIYTVQVAIYYGNVK